MFTLGIISIIFSAYISLFNWHCWIESNRNPSNGVVSGVPLVGGMSLGFGLYVIPQTQPYFWLAILLDYGTLILIPGLPYFAYQVWLTSRFNLLHSFESAEEDRKIEIKLFRRGIALFTVHFNPPRLCNDNGARIQSFGMSGSWITSEQGFLIKGYAGDRELLLSLENGNFSATELHYPSEKKYNYDTLNGMNLRRKTIGHCG